MPAQTIEKARMDTANSTQTSAVNDSTIYHSNTMVERETPNDSTAKADTINQKIKERERAELRKEKKKALIGLAIVGGIMIFFGLLAFVAWAGPSNT